MNLVDEFVKKAILRSYSIFPTRNHVLEHLFLTIGNGMEWVKGADWLYVLASVYSEQAPRAGTIPFIEPRADRVIPNPAELADLELQNFQRDWTNRHIDLVCQDLYFEHQRFPSLYRSCLTYACIAEGQHPPVEQIHPDWRRAVRKFATDALAHIRGVSGYLGDDLEVLKRIRLDLYEPFVICKRAAQVFITAEERAELQECDRQVCKALGIPYREQLA